MVRYAIIVAGGKGTRMGASTPKQFILLSGKPILMHTLLAFEQYSGSINLIVVLPEAEISTWKLLCKKYDFSVPHQVTSGGETRSASVRHGLACIDRSEPSLVAVHDGVRPFVTASIIQRCYDSAGKYGSGVPVVQVKDSVRRLKDGKNFAENRSQLCLVQTPQVFRTREIWDAYQQQEAQTDDATLYELSGKDVTLVDGSYDNIKITTKDDLLFAEALMKSPDYRR